MVRKKCRVFTFSGVKRPFLRSRFHTRHKMRKRRFFFTEIQLTVFDIPFYLCKKKTLRFGVKRVLVCKGSIFCDWILNFFFFFFPFFPG